MQAAGPGETDSPQRHRAREGNRRRDGAQENRYKEMLSRTQPREHPVYLPTTCKLALVRASVRFVNRQIVASVLAPDLYKSLVAGGLGCIRNGVLGITHRLMIYLSN